MHLADANWLTPELATFLAALLVSLIANLLTLLGKRDAAAKAESAAPMLGAVAGAIAMVRRDGKLDAVSQKALLGALKQTSASLGVSKALDAVAAGANALPPDAEAPEAARIAAEAAAKVLAPATTGDVMRRITGRL